MTVATGTEPTISIPVHSIAVACLFVIWTVVAVWMGTLLPQIKEKGWKAVVLERREPTHPPLRDRLRARREARQRQQALALKYLVDELRPSGNVQRDMRDTP